MEKACELYQKVNKKSANTPARLFKIACELFNMALKLDEDTFRRWLCYVYWIMMPKMSKKDLELIEKYLKEFLDEQKENKEE